MFLTKYSAVKLLIIKQLLGAPQCCFHSYFFINLLMLLLSHMMSLIQIFLQPRGTFILLLNPDYKSTSSSAASDTNYLQVFRIRTELCSTDARTGEDVLFYITVVCRTGVWSPESLSFRRWSQLRLRVSTLFL